MSEIPYYIYLLVIFRGLIATQAYTSHAAAVQVLVLVLVVEVDWDDGTTRRWHKVKPLERPSPPTV